MKHSKKKKTLLAVAPSLAATGITLVVRGQHYQGAALLVMSSAMFVIYDYLNDKGQPVPEIPAGIDEETFVEVAEVVGDRAEDYHDSTKE